MSALIVLDISPMSTVFSGGGLLVMGVLVALVIGAVFLLRRRKR